MLELFLNEVDKEDDEILCYTRENKTNGYLEVVREKIKYKITPRSCFFYLCSHFPTRKFTLQDVQKCYIIFDLILRKCNFFEHMEIGTTHIGYKEYNKHYGLNDTSKSEYSLELLFNHSLRIICYDLLNQCSENSKKFVWSIDQILDNDEKYVHCLKFWSNIIEHQDIRDVLLIWFPDEIIDVIFSLMRC